MTRRHPLTRLLTLLLAVFLFTSAARAEDIRVSAAISLLEALTDAAKTYQSRTHDQVLLTFGSSGQLSTQIQNGADVDLFISAAQQQIDDLIKAKLADPAKARIIARNSLVLIVPSIAKDAPRSFEDLAQSRFRRIAIGNPATVPAGDYAAKTLDSLKLADTLHDRLVYGTNVRQVLAYVEQGEVAAGIVYSTDARQSGNKVRTVATASEKDHPPIIYPAVPISSSKHPAATARFLDFLQSPEVQKILAEKGFAPATPSATTQTSSTTPANALPESPTAPAPTQAR